MIGFFVRSKKCAKKRLVECIKSDRRSVLLDSEKIRAEIENVLKRYVDIDGEITLEIASDKNKKRYITACAFIR